VGIENPEKIKGGVPNKSGVNTGEESLTLVEVYDGAVLTCMFMSHFRFFFTKFFNTI